MKTFWFKRHFKQLGFRSPDWQRARLIMVKNPLAHMSRLKKEIVDRFPKWKKK